MTSWTWKCRKCGIEIAKYIAVFTEICPNCKTEYIQLGAAYGLHQLSGFPIYIQKDEAIDNEKTKNQILFAINCKAKKITCFSKELLNFINENYNELLNKNNVKLILEEQF